MRVGRWGVRLRGILEGRGGGEAPHPMNIGASMANRRPPVAIDAERKMTE